MALFFVGFILGAAFVVALVLLALVWRSPPPFGPLPYPMLIRRMDEEEATNKQALN